MIDAHLLLLLLLPLPTIIMFEVAAGFGFMIVNL